MRALLMCIEYRGCINHKCILCVCKEKLAILFQYRTSIRLLSTQSQLFSTFFFPDLRRGRSRIWTKILCIITGGEGKGGNAFKSIIYFFFKRMYMKEKSQKTPTCLIDGNILCLKLRQGMGEGENIEVCEFSVYAEYAQRLQMV